MYSQLSYIGHLGMFAKRSQAYFRLLLVWMAKLGYLLVKNTWNLSIFINIFIKLHSLVWKLVSSKKFRFLHSLQSIFIYMFAWFNLVMFFSLFFVYVYLQFTEYGLVFIWLAVEANELRKDVLTNHFDENLFLMRKDSSLWQLHD